ncbi:MAG TPA: hypothetical protein PLK28_12850 [Candidatus Rifleibacterium sp.]|nr:hypothetical protein [Candidatus Rifleibacterium sp.]HPW57858.1 hypothetical protein [Candidatus Rifleibacterium sp.]
MNVQRRRGIAIPLVLLFVFVVSVYFFSMAFTRTETRRQGLSNLNQRQAYYMAMGGVQQALLKIRLLHREAYDAGSLARGICPFFNPYGDNLVASNLTGATKTFKARNIFMTDLNSGQLPVSILNDGGAEFAMPNDDEFVWGYEVTELEVSTYYTSATDGSVRQVAKVTALGTSYDPRTSKTGRREKVTKSIELHRRIQ